MKIRKLWKNSMLLIVGLTVLMMTAASVTAEEGETEAPIPDDHDASNGERGVEDPLTDEHNPDSPYWDTDGNVIIAPNPGDTEDTMTDDITADDDTVITAGLPVFGVLAAIGILTIALIIRNRKNKKE